LSHYEESLQTLAKGASRTAASSVVTKVRSGPFMSIDTKGGKQPFAASAKSKGQREESGRPEYPSDFSVVQVQRTAALSPTVGC
jgi:hypothetical protein